MRPIAAGREPSLIQLDAAARPGPPTDFIYNDWYPALRTDTLREPVTTTLLNIPLLLGRKRDNSLFALRDLCPHRGIPLSAGWFDGETVQCKYHGWRFEPCSGRCEEIPSLTTHDNLEPTKIFANAFPVAERDGYAWVYIPAPGAGRIIPTERIEPPRRPLTAVILRRSRRTSVFRTPTLPTTPTHPHPPQVLKKLPHRAPLRRPPLQRRPRHHRPHGPRARPLRAPGLVVALCREHPRKNQALRTHQLI